ncbi:MAG: transposase, partial [Actinobacteria bacterium]|nr:transposase [Actinomycetota bacterium]
YVVAVSSGVGVFGPGTTFSVPPRTGKRGRSPSAVQADRKPQAVRTLACGLPPSAFQMLPCRTTPAGKEIEGRFACLRVVAANGVLRRGQEPREEWLIVEWPEGAEAPTDYWLSNLPKDTEPERLARLARLRWMIELDYRQLKGELGLDHYEGRSYAGFHHHCALVTCAHAFLTLERLSPKAPRPV